jgi:arsenical pump membrane protein
VSGGAAEILALALLVASLLFAIVRPFGLAEAVVAVPAAGLLVAVDGVPPHDAARTLREIGPTVGFLAAILVFGHLCAEAGVFAYLGAVAARTAGGSATRLLLLIVALAAVVTATLTLDATVVLLTPVVLATAATAGVASRPFAYACVRLANSASLLLPVSNLTNLLAFSKSGLSFGRFAALMTLPWVLVCALEWLGLRTFFRADLRAAPQVTARIPPAPRYALGVLVATIASFVVASAFDVAPAWAALAGCVALLIPKWRTVSPRKLVDEASIGFCLFVFGIAVLVDGVARHGLASTLQHLIPSGTSWPALLAVAAVAAGLANLLNNLPATLVMVALLAGRPELVLAVLVGVNVGPNLAYPGSLATLLWRRQLPASDRPRAAEFHLLGVLTVPVLLVVATAALWLSARVL